MRRRLLLALLLVVAVGAGAVWYARPGERLVRVGGANNPCACSMRIEP